MNNITYQTSDPVKHPQFILGISKDYFQTVLTFNLDQGRLVPGYSNQINRIPHETFLKTAQSYLLIRQREYCDNSTSDSPTRRGFDGKSKKGDPSIKQLLPYLVVRQLQEDGTMLYFPYRRTKGVGESRLAGNGSVGYGGHPELVDVVHVDSVIDLKQTLLGACLREAQEEFVIYHDAGPVNYAVGLNDISFQDLFIVDNSNDVGELHLGIVMAFDVPMDWKVKVAEDELANLLPMTAEQMLADPAFKPENWTSLYLNYVVKQGCDVPAELESEVLMLNQGDQALDGLPAKEVNAALNVYFGL